MKKGFSLIEVIAAIAIFSIGILAITMAFSTSLNVSKMNDVKRDTSQYAQIITEKFNAMGYNEINTHYKSIPYKDSGINKVEDFRYFNNIDDIPNNESLLSVSGNGDKELLYPMAEENKFGVLIRVTKDRLQQDENQDNVYYTRYNIYIRVWDLNKGSQSQSIREIDEVGNEENDS